MLSMLTDVLLIVLPMVANESRVVNQQKVGKFNEKMRKIYKKCRGMAVELPDFLG
jgi:hypothetical protein